MLSVILRVSLVLKKVQFIWPSWRNERVGHSVLSAESGIEKEYLLLDFTAAHIINMSFPETRLSEGSAAIMLVAPALPYQICHDS